MQAPFRSTPIKPQPRLILILGDISSQVAPLRLKIPRASARAGAASPAAGSCRGKVRRSSVTSSSSSPRTETDEARALSRRRPVASTGPAMSNTMSSPRFDVRRPVRRSHRRRSKSKTDARRALTSSSGAWSSLRPSSLPSRSSFASSPCCPPSRE